MKTRLAFVSLLGIALFTSPCFAADKGQPAPQPRAQLSAQQIVDKNVTARGGLKAWHAVQTMRMTGKIDAGRLRTKPPVPLYAMARTRYDLSKIKPEAEGKVIQLPFVMDLKRPNKMRFEIEFRGDTAVQAYDGTSGWKLRPFLGRHEIEPFTQDEMKYAAQQQELDGFLIDYAAKGTSIASEGFEKVDGRDAYKLKLTLKDGQVRHVWVDAESFLDVKIDGTRRLDGRPRPVATYLRDYRSVDGLMLPFKMETSVEGVRGAEDILIQQVELNPALSDVQFVKPNAN